MGSYILPRGGGPRPVLEETLLRPAVEQDDVDALAARLARVESKLHAIERLPSIDRDALRSAVAHTRLLCGASGYDLAEVDEPPPAPGATVEHDGRIYTVWRLTPSPLPGDARRCAILV